MTQITEIVPDLYRISTFILRRIFNSINFSCATSRLCCFTQA